MIMFTYKNRRVYQEMKMNSFILILKGLLLSKKRIAYQLNDRRHVADCVQYLFSANVNNLETIEMSISHKIQ